MEELFRKLKRPFDGTWDSVESDMAVFECIMFRLSVKSILMFKSVSKLWYDVMSTNCFTNLHRCWSKKHPKYLAYYDMWNLKDGIFREMHLMEPNGTYSESYTIPGFELLYNPLLIATFNGLICFMIDVSLSKKSYEVDLRICNPATHEVLVLPSSHESVYLPIFGVLYSNKSHIYKIFKFFSEPVDVEEGYRQCEVYSSKTGEWKLLGRVYSCPLRTPFRTFLSNNVCVNEKLYWFIVDEEEFDIPIVILMVDMDDNFREIQLPTVAEISVLIQFLIEFLGRLCLVDWTGFYIYIWIYEKKNDKWYLLDIPKFPINRFEVAHFDSVLAQKHDILFVYRDYSGLRHELLYDVRHAIWKDFHIVEEAKDKAIVVYPFFETLVPCSKYQVFTHG